MEQNTRAFITTAFGIANDLFQSSDINIQYRLVYLGPNPTDQPTLPTAPDMDGDIEDKSVTIATEYLNDDPEEIVSLRQAYGADMVAMFIPLLVDEVGDICGFANLPYDKSGQDKIRRYPIGDQIFFEAFKNRAYMALEVGCGQTDFTYAHEHGHNLSMSHTSENNQIYDFGVGYVFDTGRGADVATVMGCNRQPGSVVNGVCNRIPHFSNPDVTYNGIPTGLPGDNGADNARVADLRAPMYAAFQPSTVNNTAPTISIQSPGDDTVLSVGDSLSFVGTANDLEDGNLTRSIEWRSDIESISGSGSPFTTNLFVSGVHVITAYVTDSDGKRVEQSIRVIVQGGAPEIRVTLAATGATIPNQGIFNFPSTSVDDMPITRLFHIWNDGAGGLTIDNPASLVTGTGFMQIGSPPNSVIPPNGFTSFRVRFHVADPGNYSGQIQIESNDGNEDPYEISLLGAALDSSVQLVATYIPSLGQSRATFRSSSDNPPNFDFYFDPNLGNFEERPGGACYNGQDNPTYLKVGLGGEILNNGGIDDCAYGGSWDNNQLFDCGSEVVNFLNAGGEVVVNTDDYLTNLATCEDDYPLQPHILHNQAHWFRIVFEVDGLQYERRINFMRCSRILRIYPNADTHLSQSSPNTNFGSLNHLQARSVTTGDGYFPFVRFQVPSMLSTEIGSARLYWPVLDNPISHLILHRVCDDGWNETTMTWNNGDQQAGGSCGVVDTLTNLSANRTARFNVDSVITGFLTYTFGGETTDTRDNRFFGSREAANGEKPLLKVTLQVVF